MAVLLWILLSALAAQRLLETRLAARHERALARRGGRAVEGDLHASIVALHVGFFVLAAGEALAAPWARTGWWTVPALGVFALGQGLRLSAMVALRDRWTTRVWVVPGEPAVRRGPYRFLRHPNYVGVALELAAFPLAFGLVGTALVASAINGLLLARRVRVEERALAGVAA